MVMKCNNVTCDAKETNIKKASGKSHHAKHSKYSTLNNTLKLLVACPSIILVERK